MPIQERRFFLNLNNKLKSKETDNSNSDGNKKNQKSVRNKKIGGEQLKKMLFDNVLIN